ncbi:MAG: ribonuclease HI [Desulfobacterales bacterium]|nr:MAG: ribonuclease HI [Desulfobacterales bacterium]
MARKKKKYYAVVKGRRAGIYDEWLGDGGAEIQISGVPGATYKSFDSRAAAIEWFERLSKSSAKNPVEPQLKLVDVLPQTSPGKQPGPKTIPQVHIYTDGACIRNPGPGGYGVVLIYDEHRKELSGGFRRTTNNRMEIMAAIVGLRALKKRCCVTIYSDSRYLVNSMTKGWVRRWQKNGWKRYQDEPALNADLWEQMLELCGRHDTNFVWVRGHAGHAENERCDQLAVQAAQVDDLQPDKSYESSNPQKRWGLRS